MAVFNDSTSSSKSPAESFGILARPPAKAMCEKDIPKMCHKILHHYVMNLKRISEELKKKNCENK